MCGIVGILGPLNKARRLMFEEMLAMDALRGSDSTGVAAVNKMGVWTAKDIVLPGAMFEWKRYKDLLANNPFCLIGHNRAATRGVITAENAHPFTHGHITMVHNGTLDATWRLQKYWKFGTDSEAIAWNISQHGIDKVWGVLDGAATLVFWDSKDQSLNIISNCKRPFYMQPLDGGSGLVWSSERWTLLTAALRTGVVLEDKSKTYTPVMDTLYTFKMEDKKLSFSERKLQGFSRNNTIPGYNAVEPAVSKKKKKAKKSGGYGTIVPFKSAQESAQCFLEWKEGHLAKTQPANNHDKYSDENLKKEYPELFDRPSTSTDGMDADLDTRAVPFRQSHREKTDRERTIERFYKAFDLVEINKKYMTAEWFLTTYNGCIVCEDTFDYKDFFTAKVLTSNSAMCHKCQCDTWITSGIEPDQIRIN